MPVNGAFRFSPPVTPAIASPTISFESFEMHEVREQQGIGARVGILAGGGSLPREIAESVRARGGAVHIVAIDGEADGDFSGLAVTRVNWGQIGAMIRALKAHQTDALVIVGRVHRPELWGLRTDLGFFRNLPAIVKIVASGGDDSVLRRVVRFFESHGLSVVGPGDAAPELLIGDGALGMAGAAESDQADIETGFALVRALGPYDVGQGAVVSNGVIEAIEGAEGTDRMLERVQRQRANVGERAERRGVLVKRSKPGQDLRVDLPAIGPATVVRVAGAGLLGIAVEARKVLVAERIETIRKADECSVFVVGHADATATGPVTRFKATRAPGLFRRLGSALARPHHLADAETGCRVVSVLAPFDTGRSAVVVRNHVIAVEAGEGATAVIERAAQLRQWASLTRRRRGVAVLARPSDLTPAVVSAIDAAGYAGAAVLEADYDRAEFRQALALADKRKLFIVVRESSRGAA